MVEEIMPAFFISRVMLYYNRRKKQCTLEPYNIKIAHLPRAGTGGVPARGSPRQLVKRTRG